MKGLRLGTLIWFIDFVTNQRNPARLSTTQLPSTQLRLPASKTQHYGIRFPRNVTKLHELSGLANHHRRSIHAWTNTSVYLPSWSPEPCLHDTPANRSSQICPLHLNESRRLIKFSSTAGAGSGLYHHSCANLCLQRTTNQELLSFLSNYSLGTINSFVTLSTYCSYSKDLIGESKGPTLTASIHLMGKFVVELYDQPWKIYSWKMSPYQTTISTEKKQELAGIILQ